MKDKAKRALTDYGFMGADDARRRAGDLSPTELVEVQSGGNGRWSAPGADLRDLHLAGAGWG